MKLEWVFLRGLTRESLHWGEFPALFSRRFPDDKVTQVDLAGAGEYRHLKSPSSIPGMATWLTQNISPKLSPHSPKVLVAISLGGMVALEWMKQNPKFFSGAVLMNTSVGGISPMYQRMTPQSFLGLLQAVTKPSLREKEKKILEWVSNDPKARERILPVWQKIAEERPMTSANVMRQVWAAFQYRLQFTAPLPEILLLRSAQDRLANSECSAALQKLLKCEMKTHPTAGHDLALDDSHWTLDEIETWRRTKLDASLGH